MKAKSFKSYKSYKSYKSPKPITRVLCLGIVALLTLGMIPAVYAEEVDGNKDETVYIQLEANGRLKKATVVNAFEPTEGPIVDYGIYENIVNLSSDALPVIEADVLTFKMRNDAKEKFYYQGDVVGAVNPWVIDIVYKLDDKVVEQKTLAGASGHLAIEIAVKKNPLSKVAFADIYTLQITAVLNSEVASKVVAKGATIVTVGSNKQIAMTCLPKQAKTVVIEADINSFKMDAITATGTLTPFDIDIDTKAVTEGFDKLVTGSSDLLNGMRLYASGLETSDQAVVAFGESLNKIQNSGSTLIQGTKQFDVGLDTLDAGGAALSNGLTGIIAQLSNANASNEAITQLATQMLQNPDPAVQTLAQATLGQIQLSTGTQSALESLKLGATEVEKGISDLNKAHDGLSLGLTKYVGGLQEFNRAFKQFSGAFKDLPIQFALMRDGQEQLDSGIVTARDELVKTMEALPFPADEDSAAVNSYVSERNTPDTVQFVMKTPAISFEIVKDIVPEKVVEKTFLERLIDLFK